MNTLDHYPALRNLGATLDHVAIHVVNVAVERHFSWGTWHNRQHGFFRLQSGEHVAWAEGKVANNNPDVDPAAPLATLASLRGRSISDALAQLEAWRGEKGVEQLEFAEAGLLDLAGRVAGAPTLQLLGLEGRAPVPGLFCVLERDPAQVRARAQTALEQDLRTHLKVKLFGDVETDVAVVRAAREVIGPDAYLVGDVNNGYRKPASDEPIEPIAEALRTLAANGLSGCEDPAQMSVDQWVTLQELVAPLDLVADGPMRPAWVGLERLRPGMATVSNTHPACMGSILDAVRLGKQIQATGNRLMVGDNSLIGPACPMWTQIAIGQGADWCEAIEKPQESDVFARVCTTHPITRTDDGRFALRESLPGFGITLDEGKLRELAIGYAEA